MVDTTVIDMMNHAVVFKMTIIYIDHCVHIVIWGIQSSTFNFIIIGIAIMVLVTGHRQLLALVLLDAALAAKFALRAHVARWRQAPRNGQTMMEDDFNSDI